jgi:hypothetical protein
MFINDQVVAQVHCDIEDWTINFVESSNEFYGEKFPVCPYARSARLNGESYKVVYQAGSVKEFIRKHAFNLVNDSKHTVMLMIFPPRVKWYPRIYKFIQLLNQELIPVDYYALGGLAVGTRSAYPGLFNRSEYFVVGVNKLSNVLPSVESLRDAGYYDKWSDKHYDAVVVRRQQMYEKHKAK